MEDSNRVRWSELCIDCLVQIFSKLGLDDLTLGVPFVCKPWLRAALDPQCWKILNFKGLNLMPWGNFSSRFKQEYGIDNLSFANFMRFAIDRSHGSAAELLFPAMLGASLQDLAYASVKCPRLKVLVLPSLLQQDEKHIPELIGKWKDLQILEMAFKPSSFTKILEQLSLNCKNFMGLVMNGCFVHEDALAIVNNLPKLKYLDIGGSFLCREGLLAILERCKELEVVNVASCRGFDVDDKILKMGSRIREFEYEGAKLEEELGEEDYDKYDDVHWALVFRESW